MINELQALADAYQADGYKLIIEFNPMMVAGSVWEITLEDPGPGNNINVEGATLQQAWDRFVEKAP